MAKRTGRPTVRVTISPSERTTLEQWARRRTTAQGLAQRAQIVLACAAGRSNSAIAADVADHAANSGALASALRAEAARRVGR